MKLLIVLCVIVISGLLQRKKVQKVESTWKRFGWLCLFSLFPLFMYYFFELKWVASFMSIERDIGKTIIKTPFLYFFFLNSVWFISLFKNKKKKAGYGSILPFLLLLVSYMGIVMSIMATDMTPRTSIIEQITMKDREIIKEQFAIMLPEQIHEIWMHDNGGWMDVEYLLELEIPMDEFDSFEQEFLRYYKLSENQYRYGENESAQMYQLATNQSIHAETIPLANGNIHVTFRVDYLGSPNLDYLEMFQKDATVWNTFKRKGLFNTMF